MKPRTGVAIVVILAAVAAVGVFHGQRKHDPPSPGSAGKLVWLDPAVPQPGPIRHESLTEAQLARIDRIRQTFAEVETSPRDKWIDDFKRDFDLEAELDVWDRMGDAYTRYVRSHPLSAEAKHEVFKVVLMRSTAPAEEVLPRLELKVLTKDDAAEIMRGF